MESAAERVIRKCGGHAAVAELCGVHVTRVYRWTYPKERGGSGGLVPTKHQDQLLTAARDRGVQIEPADFFSKEPDPAPSAEEIAA